MDHFNQDELYFTINDVARQIGVVPATIRNWERRGLFVSSRAANGYRVFSMADMERLRRLKELSKDGKIGLNALKVLMASPDSSLPRRKLAGQAKAQVSKKFMSRKWRDYRLAKGYPLEYVADKISISPSYLSRIENSQTNASYKILKELARFYGENLLLYVQDADREQPVVRRGQGEDVPIDVAGLRIEAAVSRRNPVLSCMLYSVAPGCGRAEPYSHNGEEFVHVLKGRLEMTLNGLVHTLKTGDSISFSSHEEHGWRNPGAASARLLWVYTALTRL